MATPRRSCLGCGRPLSLLARPDRLHCSARCRLIAFRARLQGGSPRAVAKSSYKRQQGNRAVTEIIEIKGRGHALTIDSGWREVADTALGFVQRFA